MPKPAPLNIPPMKLTMCPTRLKDVKMEKGGKPRQRGALTKAVKKIVLCTSCKSVKNNFEDDIEMNITSTNSIIAPPCSPEEKMPCIPTASSNRTKTEIIMALHSGKTPRESYFAELEERKRVVLGRVRERRKAVAFVKRCLETQHLDASATVDTGLCGISLLSQREDKDTETNDFNPAFPLDQDIERAMNVHTGDSHVIIDTKVEEDIVHKTSDAASKVVQQGIVQCDFPDLPQRPHRAVLDAEVFLHRYQYNDNREPFRQCERNIYDLGSRRFKICKALDDIEEDFAVSAEHEISPIVTSTPLSGSEQSTPTIQTPTMVGFVDAEVVIEDSTSSPDEEQLRVIDSQDNHYPIASEEKQSGVIDHLRISPKTSRRRYAIHWDFEPGQSSDSPPPLPVGPPPSRLSADQRPSLSQRGTKSGNDSSLT